jgi:hypothetical protein
MKATGTNTATMREGGGDDGEADLGGRVEGGAHARLAHLEVAIDVLDDDDRVVDEDADRQRQRQHRDVVEAKAHVRHEREGRDHGGRDRQGGDEGRADVVQEDEDDDDREDGAEDEVELDVVDGVLGEHRVVGRHRQLDAALLQLGGHLVDHLADVLGEGDHVGAALLADDEGEGGLAVEEGGRAGLLDVVEDLGDVLDADGRAADPADDDVADLGGRLDLALGLDGQLAAAGLDVAGGELDVAGLDRAADVVDGEAEAGHARGVDQDLDLALAGADEVDGADAGDLLDALLDLVLGELGQVADRHVAGEGDREHRARRRC